MPVHAEPASPLKRKRKDSSENEEDVVVVKLEEGVDMAEELSCCVCNSILQSPFTIIPCLHVVDYRCLQRRWRTCNTCPECNAIATSAKVDVKLDAIVTKYLHCHPNKRRRRSFHPIEDELVPSPQELHPSNTLRRGLHKAAAVLLLSGTRNGIADRLRKEIRERVNQGDH